MGNQYRYVCLGVALAVLLGAARTSAASITRSNGPTTVTHDARQLVKFDAAFDSVNQVYLVVWGTQGTGPTNGQFLNVNGAPIGARFSISSGPEQAGWAGVAYSPDHQRFLVVYTKIVPGPPIVHQRAARFVAYTANGPSFLTNEIIIDSFTSMAESGGVAYSPGAGVFLTTWHKGVQGELYPRSYVAALSPAGAILTSSVLTDPNDGQTDADIACNDSGRCLVVGWAYGVPFSAKGTTSLWARFVDGAGVPAGGSSFYLDTYPLESAPRIAYSAHENQFLLSFDRDFRAIWGMAVDVNGGHGAPFLLKQSTDPAIDGGGYGTSSLAYNSTSKTFMLGVSSWTGLTGSQELVTTGLVGTTDLLPVTVANDAWPTKFTVAVADPVNNRFLVLDNQSFVYIRSTVYSVGGAPPPPPPPPPPTDTDGDGIPDASDACPTVPGATANGCPAANTPKGDLSGDGKPDILFQNTGSGVLYSFFLNNLQPVGESMLNPGAVTDTNWQIVSKEDLNADGKADLIWQHQITGVVSVWQMNGVTRVQEFAVLQGSGPWRIMTTADLNRDGYPDIIWQNPSTGLLYVWLLAPASGGQISVIGEGLFKNSSGNPLAAVGANWVVVAAGDISGDGIPDLIFQGLAAPRQVTAWYLGGSDGLTVTNASVTLSAAAGPWRVRMVNDMNSDGSVDLVWQSAGVAPLYVWLMNGPTLTGGQFIRPDVSLGPEWRVVGGK